MRIFIFDLHFHKSSCLQIIILFFKAPPSGFAKLSANFESLFFQFENFANKNFANI